MDSKLLGLLILAITASGCTDSTGVDGNGVKVESFKALDSTLTPGQRTNVEAEIRSYNNAPTTVDSQDIELFNTGQLEVLEKTCTPGEIGSAREGYAPTMRCVWTVQAPGEEFIQGFKSKPLSFEASIGYTSTLENPEALKVDFQNLQDIQQSGEYSRTVENGDIRMSLSGETPVAVESTSTMTVNVRNTGPGDLQGDYSFNYTPSRIFSCPASEEPIQGETQFSCELNTDSTGTRNLFVSTSYKYEKSPGTNIEVVNK